MAENPDIFEHWQPQMDLVAKLANDIAQSRTENGWNGRELRLKVIRLESEVKILKIELGYE